MIKKRKLPLSEQEEQIKLIRWQSGVDKEFVQKIERITAEKLLQTLHRQDLLKLELRDMKDYLNEYFKGS